MTALRVLATGPQLLVQDAGRPGRLAIGVTGSGWMDAAAARLANRLVGNDPEAALLESLLGNVEVEVVDGPVWCAVTGAAEHLAIEVDGRSSAVPAHSPVHLDRGARLRIGTPSRGMRAYLAVRGGLAITPVLGSRSTDTLSGLGTAPVSAGDLLPIGLAREAWAPLDVAPVRSLPREGDLVHIGIEPGPRSDRLRSDAALTAQIWMVGARQDRVGIRLDGHPLDLHDAPLASEGTVAGAIEVPPDGLPYVLMRDHPVTVGYPVVAVVEPGGINVLAQLRPGCRVQFVRR